MKIEKVSNDSTVNVAIDTIRLNKQAIIFCSSKKSSESTAKDIIEHLPNKKDRIMDKLAKQISDSLQEPTTQCIDLSLCVRKGCAFHHAGLTNEQKHLIEKHFKNGDIKIICSTPTLAAGVNMPAFRTIIKSLTRYNGSWSEYIPVLEYLQMSGRAGRPDFNDDHGESIMIAKNESNAAKLIEKYIFGQPEIVASNLANLSSLREYTLSILSSGHAQNKKTLLEFFSTTFYGYRLTKSQVSIADEQNSLESILNCVLLDLTKFNHIKNAYSNLDTDFISSSELLKQDSDSVNKITVTNLGRTVVSLCIDPATAHDIVTCLKKKNVSSYMEFSILHMIIYTCFEREMLIPHVKRLSSLEIINLEIEYKNNLLTDVPEVYDVDHTRFKDALTISKIIYDYMNEKTEKDILNAYGMTPGIFYSIKKDCVRLLFVADKLASFHDMKNVVRCIRKTIFRIEYGVKEDIIQLVRLRGIGRVKGRRLHRNGIRTLEDIRVKNEKVLSKLIGSKTAKKLKEQIRQK